MKQILSVALAERTYPIHIGAGLLDQTALLLAHLKHKRVAIVSNTTVAPLYLERVAQPLCEAGVDVVEIILPDGEQYKNSEILNTIYDALIQARCERTTTLIALGGGVIGGKTGINHPQGKNMIGAFYQPQLVLIDTETLKTLPQRELSAGIAEVIKYGLIRDADFFDWLEINMEKLMALDEATVSEAVYRSCQNKAEVVAADEREAGERALLNLGHTFGHAIENAMGYGVWLHGEAVAAGTLMAADLSLRMGWLKLEDVQRIKAIFHAAELKQQPPALGVDQYLDLMGLDKKVQDGQIRLVLQQAIGESVMTSDYNVDALRETLSL